MMLPCQDSPVDRRLKARKFRNQCQPARPPAGAARCGVVAAAGRSVYAAHPGLAAPARPAAAGDRRRGAGSARGGGAPAAGVPARGADRGVSLLAANVPGKLPARLLAVAAVATAGDRTQRLAPE